MGVLLILTGCALPTAITPKFHGSTPPPGASLYVVNPAPISPMGVLKTFIMRWDPKVEMAISEQQIKEALKKRGRLAKSVEEADVVLKLVEPKPEDTGVSEECEVIRRSPGQMIGTVNRKADSWDEAVSDTLKWLDTGKLPD